MVGTTLLPLMPKRSLGQVILVDYCTLFSPPSDPLLFSFSLPHLQRGFLTFSVLSKFASVWTPFVMVHHPMIRILGFSP